MRSTLPTRDEPEALGQQDDVERLVPGHVHQADRDLALDLVAGDDVELGHVGDEAQHVRDLDVLEVERDAAARVALLLAACRLPGACRSPSSPSCSPADAGGWPFGARRGRLRVGALHREAGRDVAALLEVDEEHRALAVHVGHEALRAPHDHAHLRGLRVGLLERRDERNRTRLLRGHADRGVRIDRGVREAHQERVLVRLHDVVLGRAAGQDRDALALRRHVELHAHHLAAGHRSRRHRGRSGRHALRNLVRSRTRSPGRRPSAPRGHRRASPWPRRR